MKDYLPKVRTYIRKTISIWWAKFKIRAIRLFIKICGKSEEGIKKMRSESSHSITRLNDSKNGLIQERKQIFRQASEEVRHPEVVDIPKKKAS